MIKLNGKEVEIKRFPDGTSKISCMTKKEIRGIEQHTITWLYDGDEEMFTLLCLVGHLRDNGAIKIDLKMPYVPNARMDRTERDVEVHTLKYFGNIINSMKFGMVEVFDPHSSATELAISPINVILPMDYIQYVINQLNADGNLILYYPDEGACFRYKDYFPGMRYVFGEKKRDWDTTKIKKLGICGDMSIIKDANILMIDDICASGGTLLISALRLKELGAKNIFVYASHTEKRLLDTELAKSGLIKEFYTTNSILRVENLGEEGQFQEDEFIKVIQIGKMTLHVFKAF